MDRRQWTAPFDRIGLNSAKSDLIVVKKIKNLIPAMENEPRSPNRPAMKNAAVADRRYMRESRVQLGAPQQAIRLFHRVHLIRKRLRGKTYGNVFVGSGSW